MDIQNRFKNVTIAESNKTALVHFPEMVRWCLPIPINIAVLGPQNEFTGDMQPTVPYYSYVQVPDKHDFSETF